jgi:hypothetical protein
VFTLTNNETSFPPTSPDQVGLTTAQTISESFTEIGYVFAFGNSQVDAVRNLQKQAALYGGNKVIRFQVDIRREYIWFLFIPIAIDHYYAAGIVVKSNI